MKIEDVIADLRRRAAALNDAADTLDETFLGSSDIGGTAPARWAPGLGEPGRLDGAEIGQPVPDVRPRATKSKALDPGREATDRPRAATRVMPRTKATPPPVDDEPADQGDEPVQVTQEMMDKVVDTVMDVARTVGGGNAKKGMNSIGFIETVINYLPGRKLPFDAETVSHAVKLAKQKATAA